MSGYDTEERKQNKDISQQLFDKIAIKKQNFKWIERY